MEEDEKTRSYIFKQEKKIGKKRGKRKRQGERDGSERGEEEICPSLVDDDPAWLVPDRSFERNIKINNISAVHYRCYYRAGAVACGVCFGSYGGLISFVIRYSTRRYSRKIYTPIYTYVYKHKLISTLKRFDLHRISSLIADAVFASV